MKRYGSVVEALQSIAECKHWGMLQNVAERYGSVVDRNTTLWKHCRAVTKWYRIVKENIDFAHH